MGINSLVIEDDVRFPQQEARDEEHGDVAVLVRVPLQTVVRPPLHQQTNIN